LLYDSKSLMEDQIEALEKSADITGGGQINLANLTDGLRAEREQGITIDVAYRYFATPRASSSSPTRRGTCSTRATWSRAPRRRTSRSCWWMRANGVIEQSRRHTCIAALLGIPHLVIAVNKMDLVDWSEERFLEIRDEFEGFLPEARRVARREVHPHQRAQRRQRRGRLEAHAVVSGADAAGASRDGPHRQRLESQRVPVPGAMGEPPEQSHATEAARFPRPERPDRGGIVRKGQQVLVLPSGIKTTGEGHLDLRRFAAKEAFCPQSVTIVLEDDVDISRGDMIVGLDLLPGMSNELHARVCWMNPVPCKRAGSISSSTGTQTVQAVVTQIEGRINIRTSTWKPARRTPRSTTSASSVSRPPSRSFTTATRPTG
jgi:sulfate adenylyltransferase subunit 1